MEGKKTDDSALFEHSLLKIQLMREVPEAARLRRIEIKGSAPGAVERIDAKAADGERRSA